MISELAAQDLAHHHGVFSVHLGEGPEGPIAGLGTIAVEEIAELLGGGNVVHGAEGT